MSRRHKRSRFIEPGSSSARSPSQTATRHNGQPRVHARSDAVSLRSPERANQAAGSCHPTRMGRELRIARVAPAEATEHDAHPPHGGHGTRHVLRRCSARIKSRFGQIVEEVPPEEFFSAPKEERTRRFLALVE